jgi:hypothetical protein
MAPNTRNKTNSKISLSKTKAKAPIKAHATRAKSKSASQKNLASHSSSSKKKSTPSIKKTNEPSKIDFSNTKSVSAFISKSTNLFSDVDVTQRIRKLNSSSALYVASAHNSVKRVFSILLNHPTLSGLAEMVTDPLSPSEKESNLILLIRGTKTHDKYNILNTALLAVALELKKKTHSNVNLTTR